MASYQSGFDPPNRVDYSSRGRRVGTSTTPSNVSSQAISSGRVGHREADVAHISGQMDTPPTLGRDRVRRTNLPILRSREAVPPSISSNKPKASSNSEFRRQAPPAPKLANPPLQKKNSRNILRRNPPTLAETNPAQQSQSGRSENVSTSQDPWSMPQVSYSRPVQQSFQPMNFADEREPTLPNIEWSAPIIPELDRYRSVGNHQSSRHNRFVTDVPHKLATHDLSPPTPLNSGMSGGSNGHSGYSATSGISAYSASPATRYSESPGPGAFSRDTTPTSMSSHSPGIVAPPRVTPRMRQGSPTRSRPPLSSRGRALSNANEKEAGVLDIKGLPSLRESLTSSSSGSTVKGEKADKAAEKKKKKKRLSPLPPSPPPRKSSQKFQKSLSEAGLISNDLEVSPSKKSRTPAKSVMTSPVIGLPSKSATPIGSPEARFMPPRRPSRDGTLDLSQLGEPTTVIQSNLAGLNLSPERRQSFGLMPRPLAQPSGPSLEIIRSNNTSRLPSRGTSPMAVGFRREATPAPAGLGIIPDLRPSANQTVSQRTVPISRTPSPSTAAPKHRFGLFTRRAKTTPEVTASSQAEKQPRKGPAAGTGHEGYGRYALRSRSQSIPANRGHTPASSQDTSAGNRTQDPFLLQRMSPVVIAGGGEIVSNRNESLELTRSESSQSIAYARPSIESKASSTSNLSTEVSRTTLWPSALPRGSEINQSSTSIASKGTYASESSDNDYGTKSSLAFRRSMNRLVSSDQEPFRLPRPLQLSSGYSSPSQGPGVLSNDSEYEAQSAARKGKGPAKKLMKRPRSPRKWNPFQRSQPATTTTTKSPPQAVSVVVKTDHVSEKPVPYYAMLDSSEQENDGTVDMEEILRDADIEDFARPREFVPEDHHQVSAGPKQPMPEMTMAKPSTPVLSGLLSGQKGVFNSPEPLPESIASQRQEPPVVKPLGRPRLAQVGRIPRVVPARPQQTSPKSFSRPFARHSLLQPVLKLDTVDRRSIALGPSPERSPSPPSRPSELSPTSAVCALGLDNDIINIPQTQAINSATQETNPRGGAFFVISPRKNSATTISTSSEAICTTAIVPQPEAALQEDEVWDEYDDLIGDEELRIPQSATSSHGVPFQYERFESRALKRANSRKKESPIVNSSGTFLMDETPPHGSRTEAAPSSLYSPDLSAGFKSVFKAIPSPSTPLSFADFFSGYGDRNNSVVNGSGGSRHMESPKSQRNSRPSSGHSKSASMGELSSRRSAEPKLVPITEQPHESSISQVNLRVGSLTVSKWLTFGHVLFSPAREEILNGDDPAKTYSVLVVDGLGNDDFSYYACETHPTATFYNLSPTAPISSSHPSPHPSIQTPPNHRQVQYTSTLDKFPFPRSTFTAVVLRFPPASSDTAFRNLITEARRVLKPGGYLELSILDLDMLNMGNRTRRAIRGLKVNIAVQDPEISLASASDTVLRVLGKRAFEDVKSCKVGVPVASIVTASSSAGGARGSAESGSSGNGNGSGNDRKSDDNNDVSLADMMKDESSVGDDGIAKMVAKVGRFWFLKCYERTVLPNGDTSRSIFSDAAVLRECERWNTSFKLLVCYAQKPGARRRRTASV